MNRQEFFKELKFALRKHKYADVEAVLDYYDELIMERQENGEREADIIASFDSIDRIVDNMNRAYGEPEFAAEYGRETRRGRDPWAPAGRPEPAQPAYPAQTARSVPPVRDPWAMPVPAQNAGQNAQRRVNRAVNDPGPKSYGRAIAGIVALPVTLPLRIALIALIIALSAATFALALAIWGMALGLIGGGISAIVYGGIIGIASQSWMMLFGFIGAGFVVTAIGIWSVNLAVAASRGVFKLSAKLLRSTARLFSGKKKVDDNENK